MSKQMPHRCQHDVWVISSQCIASVNGTLFSSRTIAESGFQAFTISDSQGSCNVNRSMFPSCTLIEQDNVPLDAQPCSFFVSVTGIVTRRDVFTNLEGNN
jgi:hypothetical protein